MKKFLSGVLCATLVFSLTLSALAISGKMTIEVDPINIMVNGEVFVPKDVNGKEVPQFAYQGTTYAPLRALAEAYGLEVGYDAAANMATVQDPDAPVVPAEDHKTELGEDEAYQEFASLWSEPKFVSPFAQFRCKDNAELQEIATDNQDKMDDWFHRLTVSLVDAHPEYVAEKGAFILTFNLADPVGGDPIYSAMIMSPFDSSNIEQEAFDLDRVLNLSL